MTTTLARARRQPEQRRRPTVAAFRPARNATAGLGVMLGLVLRRNRVRLGVWLAVIVGLFAYVAAYYNSIFTTQQALDDFARIGATPSMRALTGVAAVPNTLGGAVWTKIWMTLVLTLAFGVVFLVTRNGRAEEEAGRAELLRSRVLGVHAASLATYVVVGALCLAGGLGVSLASMAMGLDPAGAGVAGSLVMGASVFGVGVLALGVAAVAGQLASTGRGANALGSAVLGGLYVLRMSGDMNDSALIWISPIGWAEQMAPYGPDRWWPLLLLLGLATILLAAAVRIEGRRDHASGLLPDRPGPAAASAALGSLIGLGLRLQRGAVLGWTLTVLFAGALFGSLVEAMSDLVADAGDGVAKMMHGTGTDALLSMLVMILAIVVAVFAVQTTLQIRAEEASGHVEPQLAGALGRLRWATGRLALPVLGSAILLLAGGALMGAGYGSSIDDAGQTLALAGAALAYWPAIMVLVAIAVALFGLLPRLCVPVSWGVLGLIWVLALVGDALNLPTWLLDSTPFNATPFQPLEAMRWLPIIVMTTLAVVAAGAGLARFRARDLTGD